MASTKMIDLSGPFFVRPVQSVDDFISHMTGYRQAIIVIALSRLKICDHLSNSPMHIEQIARACNAHPLLLEALLDAAVSLGYLKKENGIYENTKISSTVLVSSSPEFLGTTAEYHLDYVQQWLLLPKLLCEGEKETPTPRLQSKTDPVAFQTFVRGVHDAHCAATKLLAEMVDLRSPASLLDVGSGAGSYAIALLHRHPNLCATLLDFRPVLEVARLIVAEEGLSSRVSFLEGDFTERTFPSNFDVILVSNAIHLEPRPAAERVLKKAYQALQPDGLLVINEPLVSCERTEPQATAVFNLNVLLRSGLRSSLFSEEELQPMLEHAGFHSPQCYHLPSDSDLYRRPYTTIVARKNNHTS